MKCQCKYTATAALNDVARRSWVAAPLPEAVALRRHDARQRAVLAVPPRRARRRHRLRPSVAAAAVTAGGRHLRHTVTVAGAARGKRLGQRGSLQASANIAVSRPAQRGSSCA